MNIEQGDCLSDGCTAVLPGRGGRHRRAREHGWARSYWGRRGAGFICPDHRTR